MKSYIIHFSKLSDRYSNVLKLESILKNGKTITEHFVDSCFVDKIFNKSQHSSLSFRTDLFQSVIEGVFYNAHPSIFLESAHVRSSLEHVKLDKHKPISPDSGLSHLLDFIDMKPPSRSSIEHSLQHYYCYEDLVNSTEEWALILEDDCICFNSLSFYDQIFRNFSNYSVSFPVMIDISDGCNLKLNSNLDIMYSLKNGLRVGLTNPKRTRTSSAYMINRNFAILMMKYVSSLYFAIDWHISYASSQVGDSLIFWSVDKFFTEGSKNGEFLPHNSSRTLSFDD